jgi:hypothetical protein
LYLFWHADIFAKLFFWIHNKENSFNILKLVLDGKKNAVDAGKVSMNLLQKIIEIFFFVLLLIEIFEKL